MNRIEKKAVYNADKTECLEIGGYEYDCIEPFLPTCSKVPSKLPEYITSLENAFFENVNTKITGIEKGDTSNVTNMIAMFFNCYFLTTLDLSNFNTSSVTDMRSMFSNCNLLTTLDISNFDTSNVTDMSSMFGNCNLLTTLDLSNGDNSNVTDMRFMFNGCKNLITLNMFYFYNRNIDYIFSECEKLENININFKGNN